MDFIRYSIDRPVAVIAAVLMAVLFGILALTQIPEPFRLKRAFQLLEPQRMRRVAGP